MEWLTWFPSFHWQRSAMALALIILVMAIMMAVRPRARWTRQKPI